MRPVSLTAGPYSAASANGLVTSVTPTTGTSLALVTNTVDATPRRLIVTPVSQANPGTLLVVGTTWGGQAASETLTVPSGSTAVVTSVLDYLTVTSILPGGGLWTAAITVGTANSALVGSSAWLRCDDYGAAATQITVTVSGTITFSVEASDDDCNAQTVTGISAMTPAIAPSAMTWFSPDTTNLTGKTSNLTYELGVANTGARPSWVRLTVTAYTSTASAKMVVTQAAAKWA
jgi:hypothetical protein